MELNLEKLNIDRNKDELTEEEISYLDTLSEKEIKDLIGYCENQYNYFNAIQMALKLILNSVYGAFGNEFFVCSTTDIAGAITAMGRDVVKYMDSINEKYWYEFWHLDEELHAHLGLESMPGKLDDSWMHRESKTPYDGEVTQEQMEDGTYQRMVPVSAYVDTDSVFVSFQPVIDQLDISDEKAQEFVTKISKFRLEPLYKKKLEGYARRFKVKNIQDFELENISESVIFLTKKKYIKHVIWEDGMQYERLSYIVPKGVDLIKKGTPKFARENLMKILHYIFNNSKNYNIKKFLSFVRELKKEFELADINDIVQGCSINAYYSQKLMVEGQPIDGPGVVEDRSDLVFAKGTYYTIKAAGLYNYLLHKNPELINHYEEIKPGIKVKIYPCKHDLNDRFCFIPGKYPREFAPEVDYDELFQKTVASQVNTYLVALGLPELNKRLRVVISLF